MHCRTCVRHRRQNESLLKEGLPILHHYPHFHCVHMRSVHLLSRCMVSLLEFSLHGLHCDRVIF